MTRARQEPFPIGDSDVEQEEVVVSENQQPPGHQGMTVRTFMFNGAEREVDLHDHRIHYSDCLFRPACAIGTDGETRSLYSRSLVISWIL